MTLEDKIRYKVEEYRAKGEYSIYSDVIMHWIVEHKENVIKESSSKKINDVLAKDKNLYEEIRDDYFSFYDKMKEPERTEAKINWDLIRSLSYESPKSIYSAIVYGFDIHEPSESEDYWVEILEKYK